MPTQISLREVTVSRGDRPLLDGVSFSARPGERIGVVGENGAGKSTLLRLLSGTDSPDDGAVVTTADGGVGHLAQTPQLPQDSSVADVIDDALSELRTMEHRLRELETDLGTAGPDTLATYGDLLTCFEARGGYEADARVDRALHGLGVASIGRSRTLGSLSGGEQARLGLACLVAAAPEVMLLDEPTNHLDGAALTWLEGALRAHRGTVVAVSHDRVFLESVATAIVEVDSDRHTLVRYGGGYEGFVAEKAAARRRWEQAYEQWCTETSALAEAATTVARRVAPGRPRKDGNKLAYDRDAGRVQSSVSSRVRQAQERLRRLQEHPVPRPPEPLRFTARPLAGAYGAAASSEAAGEGVAEGGDAAKTGSAAGRADSRIPNGPLVDLDGVRVGERLVVAGLAVGVGERLLVHGPNGAGKSTLLRVMAGVVEPDAGRVVRRGRIGYLAQEIPTAHPRERLLSAFGRGLSGTAEEHRELLLSFGLFRGRDLHVPVGMLSAGQRRRLALSRLLARPADLLLLDEPTNHLALDLVEELERALAEWTGALVVVSHDRLLRRRFSGRLCEIHEGRITADSRDAALRVSAI